MLNAVILKRLLWRMWKGQKFRWKQKVMYRLGKYGHVLPNHGILLGGIMLLMIGIPHRLKMTPEQEAGLISEWKPKMVVSDSISQELIRRLNHTEHWNIP